MKKIARAMYGYYSFISLLCGLTYGSASGQSELKILASPFRVITSDSNYRSLEKKMPVLICGGILYRSDLRLLGEPRQEPSFAKYLLGGIQGLSVDSAQLKGYRHSLDSLNANYFMNGEIGITNQEFYINISATDFSNDIVSFRTGKYYPLSEFQRIVDEASETINRQMQLKHSGDKTKKLMIDNFYVNFEKRAFGRNMTDNIYAPYFLPRYLAYTIKNTDYVAVLPYSVSQELGSYTKSEKTDLLKPDLIISGEISFGTNDTCRIMPVIYDNSNDSLPLQPVQGVLRDKDQILSNTIVEIQNVVNNIDFNFTGLAQLKLLLLKNGDYRQAFDSARRSGQYDLALYYADHLPEKKSLLKGEVCYDRGNYTEATSALLEYQKTDALNPEGNYYLAMTFIKMGRYQLAKGFLSLVDSANYTAKDLHYLKGVCYYYQDSTAVALSEFEAQKQIDNTLHPDLYAYIGSLYKNKGDLKRAEENYLVLYKKDTGNIIYKRHLCDFYTQAAKIRSTEKEYTKAGAYYKKAYQLQHTDETLLGTIESYLLQKNEDSIRSMVALAARDTLSDLGNFYTEASAYCRLRQPDNTDFDPFLIRQSIFFLTQYLTTPHSSLNQVAQDLGSDYFRIKILDSADYYYRIALKFNADLPVNYFNLAELQIMESKPADAGTTLDGARKRFHLDSIDLNGKHVVANETYTALFLVYQSQCEILMRKDTRPLEARFKSISSRYRSRDKQPVLFYNWSFNTYHNWLTNDARVDDYVRKKMLANLCLAVPYSYDTQLSCDF